MSNTKPIGVAFLGFGRMGETHLRNLAAIADVTVVVVADERSDRAELGKAISGAEFATTDQVEAINHSSVDAVVISTPTDTHARLIELASKAGKAVFSEKPIALDLAETQRVVQIVKDQKVPVQ
ncbi:MAG TPA: Gfo/Idh/MocA family oxidoreductase, partial [Terrimicrobiaceae bacterium]